MAAKPTSRLDVIRDHKYVEQMAQSIVDVFEVGRDNKIDQSTIAAAIKLLGDPTDNTTVWYETSPDD